MTDWYVNPDAVGGGTGVDEANAYTSLQAAETAKNADITGTESVVFLCSATGNTADNTACTIIGWTTDATHTITVKANPARRHNGLYGDASGAYKLEVTDDNGILLREDFMTVEGIQITVIFDAAGTKMCLIHNLASAPSLINLHHNILRTTDTSGTDRGIYIIDPDIIINIFNNLIYESSTSGGYAIFIQECDTAEVHNNTCAGPFDVRGIRQITGTVTVTNNVVYNTADDFIGTLSGNLNASDDQDGPGTDIGPLGADWDNEFTNDGAFDFTIKDTNANIYQAGESQTNDANVPSDDIIYNARADGSESIGCFEFVAAPSPGQVIFITKAEREAAVKAALPVMWACQGANNRRDFMKYTGLAVIGL